MRSQFGCLVVPRKDVMVIVPAFAQTQHAHIRVIRGRDICVVWLAASIVSEAVHAPRPMHGHHVTHHRTHIPSSCKCFVEQPAGYKRRQYEREQRHQPGVISN